MNLTENECVSLLFSSVTNAFPSMKPHMVNLDKSTKKTFKNPTQILRPFVKLEMNIFNTTNKKPISQTNHVEETHNVNTQINNKPNYNQYPKRYSLEELKLKYPNGSKSDCYAFRRNGKCKWGNECPF